MIKTIKCLCGQLFIYYEKENRDIHYKIVSYIPDMIEKLKLIHKLPLSLEIKLQIRDEWIKEEIILDYIESEIEYNIRQEEMELERGIRMIGEGYDLSYDLEDYYYSE